MKQGYRKGSARHWRRSTLAVAVASCFVGNFSLANPTGPAVAHGQASFSTQGNTLTVTNAPGTVINWQGFSIAGNEIARFIQQSQSSSVLNRVVGVNPSAILGALQSNGRVFLVNPNGITIGPGANIDVAGFVASTLNISDGDFLAGRMRFAQTVGAASVVNQGTINTAAGGVVYLVGSDVQNSGIIRSPQGEILLAAGKSVELVDAQIPEVRIQVVAPDNQALNLGHLISSGGRIGMYGAMVRNSGAVNANTAVVGENGKIVFKAFKDVTLDAGSNVAASGPQGGNILAQAETGTLLVSGSVKAKGEIGNGGSVKLLGQNVGLLGNAQVDVSGQGGGGTVLVGGDFQGKNPDVQNAQRTYFGPDARITADAKSFGNGGKVVIWADDITRSYGTINARGGLQSGSGGFVEVSGKNYLDFNSIVDASAPAGSAGTLWLDPTNITVVTTGANANGGQVDQFADADLSGGSKISPATLAGANATVVLQATNDITVSNPLTLTTPGAGFVAQAGRNVTINAALTTRGGNIHLEADSPHSTVGGGNGVGIVKVADIVSTLGGGARGGAVTLIGGGLSNPTGGFDFSADIVAGTGGINLSLTQSGTLDLGIGAGGSTQLASRTTDFLKTTGALVLGQATTAGSDGLGTNSQVLKVNSITNSTSVPIELSAESGSSFQLVAGGGGITLDKPLTTYQNTVISTSGPLVINQTLATSNNDLSITASSVTLGGSGSLNIGSGSFSCTGTNCTSLGVGVSSSQIQWDGGGGDGNWFNALNWNNDQLPDLTRDVTIDSTVGFGTIQIAAAGQTAQAKSLVVGRPIVLSAGSLELANASTISDAFTFSGGSLSGLGAVTVGGNTGGMVWSGGTMVAGGDVFLPVTHQSTLSGVLTLNRTIQNDGALTLNGATIAGIGSITNNGTLSALGANTVAKMLLAQGAVSGSGSLSVNDWSRTGGGFSMTGAANLKVPTGNFVVDHAYSAGNLTLQAPGGNIVLNAPVTGNAGSGTTVEIVAGGNFINNVGASAIDAGTGRWLTFSTNPADNLFGGLVSGNKAVWGRSYPSSVAETGNRYVFSDAGAVTVTTTNASKIYGQSADVSSSHVISGVPITGAATYGNVFNNAYAVDAFSSGPTVTSAGSLATANVGGGGGAGGAYPISATGNANSGFTLSFVNNGLLTVNKADYTAISGTKTYDGAATFTSGQVTLSGVNGESFNVAATADSANASLNSGATTFVSAGAVTGGGNYNALSLASLTGGNNVATINRRPLTGTIATGNSTYGSALAAGGVTLTNVVTNDVVMPATVTITRLGNTSSSGNLKAGSYTGIQSVSGLGGADAGNYDFTGTPVVGNYVVDKLALSAAIGGVTTTYGTGAATGVVTLTNKISGDAVVAGPATLVSPTTSGSNNLNAGSYKQAIDGTLSGTDSGNYTLGGFTTATNNYVVDKLNATISGSRMYNATNAASGADLITVNTLIAGDSVTVAGSGSVSDSYVASNKAITSMGTLVLTGADASNYNLLAGGNVLTVKPDPDNFRWSASSGGNWDIASNWNQGVVPVVGAAVTIADIGTPGLSENITYRSASGSTYVKSINSQESLTVTGGVLTVGSTAADLSFLPVINLSGGKFGTAGTVSVANLNLSSGGRLEGVGRIAGNVNNTAGVVAPGNSAGILTIDGDYVQGSSASFVVEIGGATAGSQYDRLVVTGNVNLGGALDVALINGFVPSAGSAFNVIQAGGALSGVFSSVNAPVTPIITPLYAASSLNLKTDFSGSVNTEQLVVVQVDQANNSMPSTNISLEAGVITASVSSGVSGAYLETGAGQIVPLTPTTSAPAGFYTNIATGETTMINAGNLPEPGFYLSSDGKTIVAITVDQETGQIVTMTGVGSKSDFDVGTKAQVKKPGVCS